jgi:hypothetical protein
MNWERAQGSAAEMLGSVGTDSRHYPQERGARFAEVGGRSRECSPEDSRAVLGLAAAARGAAGAVSAGARGRAMRKPGKNRLNKRNTNLHSFPPSHAATADGCVLKHKIECIGNSDGIFHAYRDA